ncbi:hypothetical protein A3D88_02665 [Candidatus Peribacteria bacterium RIFCSPHIGHO2_02_FULL_52_16]|nr:MAG: hypothetical protein A2706_00490 [Candidatus Peribacteria bacterium RIFCSPHIGHO2_01_FULL_51_35]OGJ61663.1 MAG: hypothetical protein A3D88_02665 [Candidatus Peribacteria bacterium RIFCSPHIGHO2_02_FULL_52_16]
MDNAFPEPTEEPSAEVPKPTLSPEHDVDENKDIAAFSYLWVMSVVVFFLKKDSPFVRFHAKQAMILFGLTVLIWFIPFDYFSRFLELIVLAGMVIGFINAAQGKKKDVPFVGPLSRGEKTLKGTWHDLVHAVAQLVTALKKFFKRAGKVAKAVEKEHIAPNPPSPPTI